MDKTINHNGRWVPRFPFPLGSSLEMLEWHQQFKVDSEPHLHCGKRLHNYGKSQCLMGKSTISMVMFNSFLYVYQRVTSSNYIIIQAKTTIGLVKCTNCPLISLNKHLNQHVKSTIPWLSQNPPQNSHHFKGP